MQVNIHEAKTQLSRLIERAERGEEVVIARGGTPVARIVPFEKEELQPRKPGGWEGRVWIADDFDDLPQEIEDLFYGE